MTYRPGDRVQLVRCTDLFTRIEPGTLGTVWLIDALGTIHVHWDNGSELGMIPDAGDRITPAPSSPGNSAQYPTQSLAEGGEQ